MVVQFLQDYVSFIDRSLQVVLVLSEEMLTYLRVSDHDTHAGRRRHTNGQQRSTSSHFVYEPSIQHNSATRSILLRICIAGWR